MRIPLAALVLVALTPSPSSAVRIAPRPVPQQEVPDSGDVLKQLRSAQARFERIRRSNLPFASGLGGGRCDENVGRFCYWYDEDDSWQQPEENEETTREREFLLRRLDSAAAALPGDRWIAGQRIRYLLETERNDAALEVAESCGAERWWCKALAGYVRHSAGDYLAAETAFESSLAAMSPDQRCEWRDISLLLKGKTRGYYEDRDCDERRDFENRFWWLSDPLYAVPGNERRTEHHARVVVGKILESSASPRSIPWGRDNLELLYRYGRVIGWQRRYSSRLSTSLDGGVVGHHRSYSWHFEPPSEYLEDISEIRVRRWDLEPERPHTRYALEYATDFRPLDHVLSLFHQNGSAAIVARCEMPVVAESTDRPDSSHTRWESALVVSQSEAKPLILVREPDCHPMTVTVPVAPVLVSVETLSRADSVAARDRYWLDIPARLGSADTLSVSDLMPIDPVSELPVDLAEAIPLARSTLRFAPADELGLYWEVYGLDPTWSSVEISLSVEKVGKGFFRRVGEWAGVVGKRSDQIRMQWIESVPATVTLNRAITVLLTPSMDGSYAIQLKVRAPNGDEALTTRLIEVEPR
ncbi:MAG: hypothetical protein JSW51_12115 [Gemmatimonadota bacterium]|nr:MAG: hypothetical protein JSW51_12115 [Gemmatimonadota bacterium]